LIILSILFWILRIILAVLLLVALALTIPVRVEVGYKEKIELTVKYLFLKFPIDLDKDNSNKPDKKKNKSKPKSVKVKKTQKRYNTDNAKGVNESRAEAEKEAEKTAKKKFKPPKKKKQKNKTLEKLKRTFKLHGLEGIVEIIKDLADICGGLLGCVCKHIVILNLDLNIVVAFEDSYKTAVNYGYVCSGVYPGLAVILRVFKYKDYNVNITTDFDKKKPEIDAVADVSVVPWFVVIGGIQALIKFLKLKAKGLI